ncbi:hypothetical protein [Pseudomonas caspiana]|uniref:Uncharacterized protein n=1 Tax=Pseudomonas caspiana TaxID=1451454 RepID=A0A1Y3P6Y3_9PSED|nr:hypothetical protein [Pseudomonas caspiana]OUM75580.1 hypothetical protein AUC60_00230 [Pseudomonas caspiana]
MNNRRLTALALASLMTVATGSVMAGATGPTDPVDGSSKTPPPVLKKNTDGSSSGSEGTSPGTKGMDPEPQKGGAEGGGMKNDQGMGGSGGGAEGGASGSK